MTNLNIHQYDFRISGLLFRIEVLEELQIPENFQPFRAAEPRGCEPDILMEIVFETDTALQKEPVKGNIFRQDHAVYERYFWREGEYIIRREPGYCYTLYPGREEKRGISPYRLSVPEDFKSSFCKQGNWLNYFSMERLLLPFGRIILHASAVIYKGKAYLFSAPSGGGKSTHATLWETYLGAEILNGDKVVVDVTADVAAAYGSPVAGSSGIYSNESAPIAAVFMLKKGLRNHMTPARGREAFLFLYSETIKSTWDTEFNSHLLECVKILHQRVPMYTLECLPERAAAEYVLQYIEKG